jgi:MFS family permease
VDARTTLVTAIAVKARLPSNEVAGSKEFHALPLSSSFSFWCAGAVLAVVAAGSAMVSPLYGVYQAMWHFSPTALTTVFSVYALALLVTLLVLGSLSDYVGRRPMMALALVAEAGAAAVFLTAHGLESLYVGRILQGIATGSAVGAVGAALLDLQPLQRPTLASTANTTAATGPLAIGAFGASLLIQYAPAPTRLVFWVLLAASAATLAAVALMVESGTRRTVRWATFKPDVGIPGSARHAFVAALPALIATFALAGLYFSLGPSLAQSVTRSHDNVWGGLVILFLSGTGTVTAVALRKLVPRRAMVWGNASLAVGSGITLAGVIDRASVTFMMGGVVAGIGFGLGFLGAFRHLTSLASLDRRGALVSSIYIVSYLAFSLPVIAAGIAVNHFGLRDVAIVYAAAIAALAVLATAAELMVDRRETACSPLTGTQTSPAKHQAFSARSRGGHVLSADCAAHGIRLGRTDQRKADAGRCVCF